MDETKLDDNFLTDAQLEAIADGIVSHSCVDVDKYLQCVKNTGDVYACTLKNFVKDDSRCDNADSEVEKS
ncbi:MAG: hypothetical protein IJ774_14055 [Selenomonadaceae bacterium]|nr:hypothetical protein [Selenomonadaceae bacterium]